MLHVTNGDSAAGGIRAAGIGGEVLPWRDVLHEGPVPATASLEELSEVRARFIAGGGWGTEDEVLRGFRERDAALADFAAHDEVVLWFEHDLYDQLQLAQVLDFFAGRDLGRTKLSLVCGPEYLGASKPERLAERFAARQAVTAAELALAADAWEAFRSTDPTSLVDFVARDTAALPFLAPALVRHLEQFPSTRDGLSRSERQALQAVAGGASTALDAFLAHNAREDPVWLGDSTFLSYLHDLAAGPTPLLSSSDGDADEPMRRRVALTDAGRAVLEGREERVLLNGIDRWLGGVHLVGHQIPWRWDPASRTLTSA
jgi:hypothetical protein